MERIPDADSFEALPPADADRLVRYFTGELSATEQQEMVRWIAAAPGREALIQRIQGEWDGIPQRQPGQYDVDRALAHAQSRTRSPSTHRSAPRASRPTWRAVTLVVSVVVIVLGVIVRPMVSRLGPDIRASERSYTTRPGQRATITLADGTVATLAPATTLRIQGRTVTLGGEAYFVVSHQTDTPFIVRAKGSVTRVLGTAFDVRAYPSDTNVRVVVQDGKVALGPESDQSNRHTILIAGNAADWTPAGIRVCERADLDMSLGWIRGTLTFDNTPLPDVIAELERWYGIRIALADTTLAQRRLSAVLKDGSTITEVLEYVTVPLGVRYTRSGDRIVFHAR